jgi:predicted dehydrogenase
MSAPAIARAQAGPKTITLALVGGAHIHTPGFVQLFKGREDVKVKYVWDHDAARAKTHADELGSQVVSDPAAIWSDAAVAGVAICSETCRHRELVLAAAQAKKHMFVEKPLGTNARESYEMADAIEKAGVLFTSGYFMRTLPAHLFLKEQVAAGNFGQISRARASFGQSVVLDGMFDKEARWTVDPKQGGFGGFGDIGTHPLDLLMWLLGDVEAVTAEVRSVTNRYPGCDECGEALLRFKNGVIGTVAAGWIDIEDLTRLHLTGTEGHALIYRGQLFYKSKKVAGADGARPWRTLPELQSAPLVQFLDAVAGQKMPLVSPREAATRVSVMEAAYRGARERTWVKPA